jgi:hypothetical protein
VNNLDKFIVCFFLLLTGIAVVLVAWKFGDNSEVFKWAVGAWGFFSGLLGGLITGVALGRRQRQEDNNEPSKPIS